MHPTKRCIASCVSFFVFFFLSSLFVNVHTNICTKVPCRKLVYPSERATLARAPVHCVKVKCSQLSSAPNNREEYDGQRCLIRCVNNCNYFA